MEQKLVVHYSNGTVIRGTTNNFGPASAFFMLLPQDAPQGTKPLMVELRSLKAIFFVRDFWGNPQHEDKKYFMPRQPYQGRKVKVTFADGEVLLGATPNYDPHGLGFFVFSADPQSNTIKTFAVNSAVRAVVDAADPAMAVR